MRLHRNSITAALLILVVSACSGEGSDASTTTSTSATETTTTQRPTTTTQAATTSTEAAATTTGAAESGEEIRIANFTFIVGPSVSVGDTVTVTNEDTVSHTWTAVDDSFDSGTLSPGDTFRFTFEEPGEYQFFCRFHSQMAGTITVQG